MNHITYIFYSFAVPLVLFDLGIEKKYSAKHCIPLLYCDFYGLLIASFVNDWVPRIFIFLINETRYNFKPAFNKALNNSYSFINNNF